uniref:Apolipoprotein C-IV n=1 Tax=Sinocyclocheilus anshuiensis TaxID=1608454 RepID=A0A671LZR9_9TELE
ALCLTSSNPLPTSAPDNTGVRLCSMDTKVKVLNLGGIVAGLHLKPVTDSYMEWAKDHASSLWERVKSRVTTFRSSQDQ